MCARDTPIESKSFGEVIDVDGDTVVAWVRLSEEFAVRTTLPLKAFKFHPYTGAEFVWNHDAEVARKRTWDNSALLRQLDRELQTLPELRND